MGFPESFQNRRIEEAAETLNVPSFLLEETTVREYLDGYNQFGDMGRSLRIAGLRLSLPEPNEEFTPLYHKLAPDGSSISYVTGRKLNLSNGIKRTLSANYERTMVLMDIARSLATEGVQTTRVPKEVIVEKFNFILEGYGLYIASGTVNVAKRDMDEDISPLEADYPTTYYERFVDHCKKYEEQKKAQRRRLESKDENLKYILMAYDRETEQHVPDAKWVYAPRMHEYAALLDQWKDLLKGNTSGATSPVEHGKYTSTDKTRWWKIHDLLRIGNEILWDGINGKIVHIGRVISDLNDLLDYNDLHSEFLPIWWPEE